MPALLLVPIPVSATTGLELSNEIKNTLLYAETDDARFCYDAGNFLSADTEAAIVEKGRALYNNGSGPQILLVFIDSLDEGTSQAIESINLFNDLELGDKNRDDGLLILLIAEGTHAQIVTGDGVADILTDGRCGRILDNYTIPYMDEDDFNTAAYETYDVCLQYLGDPDYIDPYEGYEDEDISPVFVILGIIVLIFVLLPLLFAIFKLTTLLLAAVFFILDIIFRILLFPFRRNFERTVFGVLAQQLLMANSGSGGGGYYSGGGGYSSRSSGRVSRGGGFSSGGGGHSSGGGAGR